MWYHKCTNAHNKQILWALVSLQPNYFWARAPPPPVPVLSKPVPVATFKLSSYKCCYACACWERTPAITHRLRVRRYSELWDRSSFVPLSFTGRGLCVFSRSWRSCTTQTRLWRVSVGGSDRWTTTTTSWLTPSVITSAFTTTTPFFSPGSYRHVTRHVALLALSSRPLLLSFNCRHSLLSCRHT